MPRTTFLTGIDTAAKARAAARGISYGKAYESILLDFPQLYSALLREQANAGTPGSSGSKAYALAAQQLSRSRVLA